MCRLILVAFVCTLAGGCLDSCETVQSTQPLPVQDTRLQPDVDLEPGYFPDSFQAVSIRGHASDPRIEGNSLDGARGAFDQGVRHVEIDFEMSADERIIAAHGNHLGGDCPNVRGSTVGLLRECTMDGGLKVATLGDVLELDFDAIYIDLKATGGDAVRAERAVTAAIEAIQAHEREDDAYIMTYQATPRIIELIRDNEIRAGLKGYPKSAEETGEMVDKAAQAGFDMVCVNLDQITPEVLEYSARMGVWHLAWHLGDRAKLPDFKAGARAGIGGLITRHVDLVEREVAPEWSDVRVGLSDLSAEAAK